MYWDFFVKIVFCWCYILEVLLCCLGVVDYVININICLWNFEIMVIIMLGNKYNFYIGWYVIIWGIIKIILKII